MNLSTHNAINRIDKDRESLRRVLARRLILTARAIQSDAKHGQGDFTRLTPIIARQALLSRLTGMWRGVTEYERATKRKYQRPMLLSRREKEDKDDREVLAWLIAFLGISDGKVETLTRESFTVARRATAGIESPVMRRLETAAMRGEAATAGNVPSVGKATTGVRTAPKTATVADMDPFGTFGKSDVLADLFPRFSPDEVADVFERAGVGKAATHTLDTWAETVAYSEFERGRDEIHKTPQVTESLYGYRWSSILDGRETQGCHDLDGYIGPKSDPWLIALAPPRHFGCRSVLIPVWQSSTMKPPTPKRPAGVTDADLGRYLAEKEAFMRSVA